MKLSDTPVPYGTPHKPGIKLDFTGESLGSAIDLPAESLAKAARTVAGRARDVDDARDLLEHLGLIDPETPTSPCRRANKHKAAS